MWAARFVSSFSPFQEIVTMRVAFVLPLALSSLALMAAPPNTTPHKVITVHEGTNMAVTVSPDHTTI